MLRISYVLLVITMLLIIYFLNSKGKAYRLSTVDSGQRYEYTISFFLNDRCKPEIMRLFSDKKYRFEEIERHKSVYRNGAYVFWVESDERIIPEKSIVKMYFEIKERDLMKIERRC